MEHQNVLLSVSDGVATITLNRPEAMNPLSPALVEALLAAVDAVAADDTVGAGVLTGAGRAFSAGGDLKDMAAGFSGAEGRRYIQRLNAVVQRLVDLEKPVIAAVNGHALGAGANLALATDIVLASEQARFGQIFRRVGLIPDFGGLYFLPRLVGLARAKELVFTGAVIDAHEAERIGLINRVVPHAELLPAAQALAADLAAGPRAAMAMAKAILNRGSELDLPTILQVEALGQGLLFRTEDFAEGVRAFLDKREPRFSR